MKQLLRDLKEFLWVIGVFIVVMFALAMYYNGSENPKSNNYSTVTTEEAIEQHKRVRGEIKEVVECTWCGGVGSVGYAGESEKQVQRTGMGLGNKCISCAGTGKVKKWKKI